MSFLRLEEVVKKYGEIAVLDHVSLSADKGEFVVFVGPSGCGKSTLMRTIAGLEATSDGKVFIDGVDVTFVAPAARQVSMVFQSYALYPHMNVRDNMAFGLKVAKVPAPQIEAAVKRAAGILQIEHLLDRRPRQLSGGQRQRVAIGRAIVRNPKLFLFDEPLSNLDAELRTQMRIEIARLHRDLAVTMVYVTHDQVEAMTLADRIVVLRAGKVEQVGTPSDLYDKPANTFVAGFIGSPRMNFLAVDVAAKADGEVILAHPAFAGGTAKLARASAARVGDKITLGLRPEQLELGAGRPITLQLSGELSENLGGTSQLYGQTARGENVTVVTPGRHRLSKGEGFTAGLDPAHAYLFDESGRAV